MKKLAFALAVAMLLTCFGCAAGETTEESTAGTTSDTTTSATTTATTTKETVPAYVSLDMDTVDKMLYDFLEDGSFGGTVIYYDEKAFGEDFKAFRENAENGKADAVIIIDSSIGQEWGVNGVMTTAENVIYLAYKDGQYAWTCITRYEDGTWRFRYIPGESKEHNSFAVRKYLVCRETFTRIRIYLSDTENYEDGFLLTSYINPVCYTVDTGIDVGTIPAVTQDMEQVKALLYAYRDGATVPENFPPVYTWDDEYGNAKVFLEFYEKAMAGTESAVVFRVRAEGGSFELAYLAYKDGKYLYVRDATRVADSSGEMGFYMPSEWSYLVKFENVSIFSVMYMLVNDNTATYEQIRDSMFAAAHNKWIANQLLYYVRKP